MVIEVSLSCFGDVGEKRLGFRCFLKVDDLLEDWVWGVLYGV